MRVAFISTYDAQDPSVFSAMGYWQGRALKEQGIELDFLGPLAESHPVLFRARQAYYKFVKHRYHTRNREPEMIKGYARQIEKKLRNGSYDAVFSAISPGSQPIAYLETDKPIAFWTDATFSGVLDFYPEFSSRRLTEATVRNGLANEKSALERASLAMYWSQWAANTAVANYDINPRKVKVVPVGPCMECNRTYAEVQTMIDARLTSPCKLLFVGVAWNRKGADTALRVATRLNNAGVKTELTIVGSMPPAGLELPDFVHPVGYIDKASPEGIARIKQLFAESHFLIVPSRAECFGLVFAEASSFGLPSLARAVGGIPSAIRNDINGRTFNRDANLDEYVDYVANLIANPTRYRELALSSFNEYQTRLNWKTAGQTVKGHLEEMISQRYTREASAPAESEMPDAELLVDV